MAARPVCVLCGLCAASTRLERRSLNRARGLKVTAPSCRRAAQPVRLEANLPYRWPSDSSTRGLS
jgi:hypothetical protein